MTHLTFFSTKRLTTIVLLIYVIAFTSCSTDEITPEEEPKSYLISANVRAEVSSEQIRQTITQSFGSQGTLFSILVRTGIKQIKISYQTTNTDGKPITASGALIIPTNLPVPAALASIQHGTIFDETDAPSYFKEGTEISIGNLLAGTGTIICMPDYIGYGDSKDVPHPYEHRKGLAEPGLDFIRAVKEYLEKENINWNKKLMIAGYSQGGYATLALQKLLEETASSEFNLVASSCGAGAYNKTLSMQTIATQPSIGEVNHNQSYIWVLQTYDRIYGLNRPVSSYFKSPFAEQIAQNGFRAQISGSFNQILQETFVKGIQDKTDTALLNAFADNDLLNWAPKTVTQFYHGTNDEYVPYFNSVTTVEEMKKRGATQVTLIPIQGGTHGTSISTFLTGTFGLFSTYGL